MGLFITTLIYYLLRSSRFPLRRPCCVGDDAKSDRDKRQGRVLYPSAGVVAADTAVHRSGPNEGGPGGKCVPGTEQAGICQRCRLAVFQNGTRGRTPPPPSVITARAYCRTACTVRQNPTVVERERGSALKARQSSIIVLVSVLTLGSHVAHLPDPPATNSVSAAFPLVAAAQHTHNQRFLPHS